MPDLAYGINLNFGYKKFDLSLFFEGTYGNKMYNGFRMMMFRSSYQNNTLSELVNAWTPDNTNTNVPRIAYKSTGSITNDMFSERFIQNASYLKIANIELGYNFPDRLFGGYVQGLRLYASAQNLARISKYRGYNVDFAGGTFTPGYNYASYPSPRTVMFGAHFSF